VTAVLKSRRLEVDGLEAFQQLAIEHAWQDGFPLVPPTLARVQAMLRYCDLPPDRVLGSVPPFYGEASIEKLAIISVMAGCGPAYFPVVCAAVQAVLEPEFNLYGIQATTSPVTPLVLVSGPIAEEVGIGSGDNAFGHGNVANATIGRAVRLVMIILGGGTVDPQVDRATHGFPGKYSFCAAENRPATPWPTFATRRGFDADASTVSVFGVHGFHSMVDIVSSAAEDLMLTLSAGVAATGTNNMTHGGEALLVLSPEHAAIIGQSGWTADDAGRFLFEHARIDMTRLPTDFRAYLRSRRPAWVDPDRYPVTDRWEDFQVVVVGGTGIHSVFLPSFGSTRAVTQPISDASGRPVSSIRELEQSD
jgi:hypothetical protein